jgi:type I restriction enzyme M protein
MAKQVSSKTESSLSKKNKKEMDQKPIEVTLWDAANKLRGSVEPAEYKHVVLSLIFLKFASDKFEQQRQTLLTGGKAKYVEKPEFYTMNNVFFS